MAGKRKGRTGLEWLLEKGSPKKAEENGSDGAAAPAAPDAPVASDVDAALALLDLPPAAPASTVLSKAPAESSLALDADAAAPRSGEPNRRTLDPVANALAMVDAPTAKTPAARSPEDKDGVEAKGAKPIGSADAAAASDADAAEPSAVIAEDSAADDDEPSLPPAAAAVESETSAAVAAHKKALSSGRSTRAFPRVFASFDVRFKKGSDAATASGRNVSIGGFFVETKKLLPEGEVFQAQLFFPKRERKLSVIAEVMWATAGDLENLDRFPPGMGCKFLDVDERDLPFIQGVIDEALAAGGTVP